MDRIVIPHCDICSHIESSENLIVATDYWHVTLAKDQAYLGRSFVTLKNHKESLTELSEEEWHDFEKLVARIEIGFTNVFGAGRPFNWACMMNDAFKNSDPSPHVHWHVRPRYKKPVYIDSVEFADPEFGHHYDRGRKEFVDEKMLNQITSMIKDTI